MFGTYQEGWPQLADSTQEQRVKQGFSPNDPLFRSGALQGAVHAVPGKDGAHDSVFIGVVDGQEIEQPNGSMVDAVTVMAAQEYGTDDGRVPPRPVFGTVMKDMGRFNEAAAMGIKARMGL